MAINPETQYPGKINPSDTDYPYGSARNVTLPGDGTGTPWEAALVNDLFGWQQALLQEVAEAPSGSPEKVTASQYLDAIKAIVDGRSGLVFADVSGMTSGTTIGGFGVTYSEGQALKTLSPTTKQWEVVSAVTNFPLGGGLYAQEIKVRANVAALGLLGDIKGGDYAVHDFMYLTGDDGLYQNTILMVRRPDFDDAGNAGSDPEVLGGTLFAYDANGAAFTEVKNAISGRSRSEGKLTGRQTHIYRWGSPYGGNDWCFVRTPDNYDPARGPHPFVILNHGNGWVMDGTIATANFSDKTQFGVDTQNGGAYLDTGRPDYVEFSSPMIEAFLAEGYVVCGAQNDGQNYGGGSAGYGNRETAQNIKLFFDHMQENYNVKKQVNFIAASNGSIATINATRILGKDRVRSIILLYPLLNLHYAWSTTYSAQVAEAYNFTSNNNFTEFRSSTQGYDPFTSDVEYGILPNNSDETAMSRGNYYRMNSGGTGWVRDDNLMGTSDPDVPLTPSQVTFFRRIAFNYPRIRCLWSPDDTVTPGENHWTPFKNLVNRGYSELTFEEEVLGQHGDYRHFEGLDGLGVSRMITWTKL